MTPATQPLTHERAIADLRAILYSAQHARSVFAENGWTDDDTGVQVMESLSPWLYGDRCIVLPLVKLIERCEQAGKVKAIDYFNMLIIAHRTPSILVGVQVMHDRELPEPDLKFIVAGLGQGSLYVD